MEFPPTMPDIQVHILEVLKHLATMNPEMKENIEKTLYVGNLGELGLYWVKEFSKSTKLEIARLTQTVETKGTQISLWC
jgi:hypothetical protein